MPFQYLIRDVRKSGAALTVDGTLLSGTVQAGDHATTFTTSGPLTVTVVSSEITKSTGRGMDSNLFTIAPVSEDLDLRIFKGCTLTST